MLPPDARFHDAIFLRIPRRTGVDSKTVTFGTFAVRSLNIGLVIARFGDGALGVVDNDARGNAAKAFKRAPVTAQPRGDALIPHEFGILMP